MNITDIVIAKKLAGSGGGGGGSSDLTTATLTLVNAPVPGTINAPAIFGSAATFSVGTNFNTITVILYKGMADVDFGGEEVTVSGNLFYDEDEEIYYMTGDGTAEF